MPHFFVKTDDIKDNFITVSEKPTVHHLVRVLRVKTGEKLLLVDENQTQYETEVLIVTPHRIETKILKKEKSQHFLKTQIYLAQSVLKNDAQALVIQKATELGVKGIIPLYTDNTVLKESIIDTKIDKWNKIALEAVKQCERTDIPKVYEKTSLENILKDDNFEIKIACVERSQDKTIKEVLRNLEISQDKKVLLIIGPEGGFSAAETKLIENSDVFRVSLGRLILRAETAVITALSNTIYELENE